MYMHPSHLCLLFYKCLLFSIGVFIGQPAQQSVSIEYPSDPISPIVHNMSSEMKATSAASWVQTQLTNFFQSGDDEAQANVVLQQIFAPNCEVRKDHTPQDLAAFETDLLGRKGASEVTWGDVISTEGSGDEVSVQLSSREGVSQYDSSSSTMRSSRAPLS